MKTAAIFLFIVILWRVAADGRALISNLRWLKKQAGTPVLPPQTRFVICIAALNEQRTIEATIDYFASLDYPKHLCRLIIATTDEDQLRGKTTRDVALKAARRVNKIHRGFVSISHYPGPESSKPKQLEHAVQGIRQELHSSNTYFAVFDADSRPALNTLRVANTYIRNQKKVQGQRPAVLQQLSLYTLPSAQPSGIATRIAEGAAIHQSLWTLAHEITRFRKQSERTAKLRDLQSPMYTLLSARIANCIAHGLFIHGPHYLRYPLPTDLLTEDWPYGFMQCALRYPIHALPCMDIAESPARPVNIYRQKSTWFNPFFELLPFIKQLLRSGQYQSKFETYFLGLQAYGSLLVFLLHSFVWLGALSLALSHGVWLTLAWAILFAAYWFIPAYLYRQYVRDRLPALPASYAAIFWGSVYVLSHSAGPLWSTGHWAKAAIRKVRPVRVKTEYV